MSKEYQTYSTWGRRGGVQLIFYPQLAPSSLINGKVINSMTFLVLVECKICEQGLSALVGLLPNTDNQRGKSDSGKKVSHKLSKCPNILRLPVT